MRRLSRFALLLTVAVSVGVSAQLKRFDPEWNRPATPHQVIGPVYFVGTNALAAFLITTPQGHILVDPGYEESVPLVKNSIRTLGFKYEDVRIFLYSQADVEHDAGLAQI